VASPRVELLPSGRFRGIATVDGRRRSRTFGTDGEAFVWADTLMRKADRTRADIALAMPAGEPARPPAPTLEAFLPVFLNSRMVEPETVDNYKSIMQAALREFGHRPLRDGEFDHLELKTWVANMSRLRGKDRRSPRTIAARLKALRSLFTEAVRAGYLSSDPTAGIKLPKAPTRPFRIIEWDEEPPLLEAVTAEDLLEATLLALDAGLRWGEVYGLHVANVNRLRRQIDVTDVLARPDFLPRPYPKGKKTRPVPMTQRLTEALEARTDTGKGVIRCPDRGCESGGWLLFSHAGAPVNYYQWKASFERAVKAAGLAAPAPTFHKLRHTFGTRLAAAGMPSKDIAEVMGHESTETTDLYVHAAAPSTREAWLRHALEGASSPLEALPRNLRPTAT
jgi:integrase